MATPRSDSYTVAAGASVYAGLKGPPAWLAGAPLNQWQIISNTVGPSMLQDYTGVAVRDESALTEIFVGAGGGHASAANTLNNSVYTINLQSDVPSWVQRKGPSDTTGFDPATMAIFPSDGAPAPRHLYTDVFWSPEAGEYIIGGRFLVLSYDTRATHFSWSPTTLNWTRLPDRLSDGVCYSAIDSTDGTIYSMSGSKYNPVAKTHTPWALTGSAPGNRMCSVVDSKRRELFNISFGDGWSYSSLPLVACAVSLPGGAKRAINFNSSPGLTSLLSENIDNWLCAAIEYNADLDVYYFYAGYQSKNLYVITPNSGSTWDIALKPIGGVVPPNMNGTILNKMRYISRFKALFLFFGNSNVHYMRTQ